MIRLGKTDVLSKGRFKHSSLGLMITAATLGAGGYSRHIYAGTCTGYPNASCSGAAQPGVDSNVVLSVETLSTQAGFGLAGALNLSAANSNGLNVTDAHASPITITGTGVIGISVYNGYGGPTVLDWTGAITADNSDAVQAGSYNSATDLTISLTDVTSNRSAVFATQNTVGSLQFSSTGTLTGLGTADPVNAVHLSNYSGNSLSVSVNNVAHTGPSGQPGIFGAVQILLGGTGPLAANITGSADSVYGFGVIANSGASTTTSMLNIANASGTTGAIVSHLGAGELTFSSSGLLEGTDAEGLRISVTGNQSGPNNNTIDVNNVTGGIQVTGASTVQAIDLSVAGGVTGGINLLGSGLPTVTFDALSGSSVEGGVHLGDGSDVANIATELSSVNLVDGGAGDDSLIIDTTGGQLTGSNLINWEQVLVDGVMVSNVDASTLDVSGGDGLTVAAGGVFAAGTAFNLTGDLQLASGASFDARGNSPSATVVTGSFTQSGELNLLDSELNDSFTVTADYIGDGGVLRLDTVLDDGTEAASGNRDVFFIAGNSSDNGTPTQVFVNNVGGLGADTGTGDQDGVLLIEVTGTSDARFELASPLAVGGFVYSLVQSTTDGNWYLQSTGGPPSPPAGTAAIPTMGAWLTGMMASLLAGLGFVRLGRRSSTG